MKNKPTKSGHAAVVTASPTGSDTTEEVQYTTKYSPVLAPLQATYRPRLLLPTIPHPDADPAPEAKVEEEQEDEDDAVSDDKESGEEEDVVTGNKKIGEEEEEVEQEKKGQKNEDGAEDKKGQPRQRDSPLNVEQKVAALTVDLREAKRNLTGATGEVKAIQSQYEQAQGRLKSDPENSILQNEVAAFQQELQYASQEVQRFKQDRDQLRHDIEQLQSQH
jgi:hypothetical protein